MNLRADMCGSVSKGFQPSEQKRAMVSMLNRSFDAQKYTSLERVLLGVGASLRVFGMREGESSMVSTCRRLPEVLRCNVFVVIT